MTLSENGNYFSPDSTNAAIVVGATNTGTQGVVSLYGPKGINLMNQTSLNSNRIVSLAAGVNATDAVNVSQLA